MAERHAESKSWQTEGQVLHFWLSSLDDNEVLNLRIRFELKPDIIKTFASKNQESRETTEQKPRER